MAEPVVGSIEPRPDQLSELISSEHDGPVVMLNLLRFREQATGIDAADGISGAQAYARYGAAVQPFLERVGGEVLIALAPEQSVIGPVSGEWDLVLAVRYPSRDAFVRMISDPDYLTIHAHRTAGLADSRLLACETLPVGGA